jgi:PKD repeat protein
MMIMKKIYILISMAALSGVLVEAQITIKSADLPSNKDKEIFYSTSNDTISYAQTDTNYFWDYSYLKAAANDTVKFQDPSSRSLLFFAFYGNVTDRIYSGQFANNYGFFSNTSTSYSLKGVDYGNQKLLAVNFNKADVLYKFPLAYGNVDSSNYSGSSTLVVKVKVIGKRVNTVDGWGKIKTPFGTFSCIRIKSEITESDTVAGFGFPANRTEYKWLAKGGKIPILQVNVTKSILGTTKTIDYRDSARKIRNIVSSFIKPDFKASDTVVYSGDTIHLTNKTTDPVNILKYKWGFSPAATAYVNNTGDTSRNPVVVLTDTGKYNVSLSATVPIINLKGDTIKLAYITVLALHKPVADFYANKRKATTADVVTFTDNSINHPTQWTWIVTPSTVSWMGGTNSNSSNPMIRFDSVGTYSVTLVASNKAGSGNVTKTNYITVTKAVGIAESNFLSSMIEVYPNPSRGNFHISLLRLQQDKILKTEIIDMNGKIVYTLPCADMPLGFDIDVARLPVGVYNIRLSGKAGTYIKPVMIY